MIIFIYMYRLQTKTCVYELSKKQALLLFLFFSFSFQQLWDRFASSSQIFLGRSKVQAFQPTMDRFDVDHSIMGSWSEDRNPVGIGGGNPIWGRWTHFWGPYFSDGLVQPPTNLGMVLMLFFFCFEKVRTKEEDDGIFEAWNEPWNFDIWVDDVP